MPLLLKTQTGPKEGRAPPGLLSPAKDRRRRGLSCRMQAVFLIGILLLWSTYEVLVAPRVLASFEEQRHNLASLTNSDSSAAAPFADSESASSRTAKWLERGGYLRKGATKTPGAKDQRPLSALEEDARRPERETDGVSAHHDQDDDKSKATKGVSSSSTSPSSSKWAARPNFEHDLQAVVDLLPDEVYMREFLNPINFGGAQRMRELGIRTRAYQKYFRAWEALHLAEDEETGEVSVRDDVVQYLRHSHQATPGGSSSNGEQSLVASIHSYDAFRDFMVKFARTLFPFMTPYFSDHMALHSHIKSGGRGIVLTGGDGQAKYLMTTIYMFRELGCDLPIEVMYLGEGDLGEDRRIELESLPNVTTRDMKAMVNDEGWALAGWAAKPYAILMSSFREVIMIDADSLFMKDPAVLFDDPDYIETGALFFRDRLIMPESKRRLLQSIFPRPIPSQVTNSRWWKGTSGHEQESGVVVVDKWKHFISLLLVCRFNGSDRDSREGREGVYELMYGDKETFWIGFLLAGDSSFAYHKGAVGILGTIEPPKEQPASKSRDDAKEPVADSNKKNSGGKELKARSPLSNESTGDEDNDASSSPTNDDREASESKEDGPSSSSSSSSSSSDADADSSSSSPSAESPSLKSTSPSSLSSSSSSSSASLSTPETNYTICAPQLLHLDRDGSPLWFNGWLVNNKFADKSLQRWAEFDTYLAEPPLPLPRSSSSSSQQQAKKDFWELGQDNMCCLTAPASQRFEFDERELSVLRAIFERAEEVSGDY